METSPMICRANQWTGFYMIMASVMKELKSNTCLIIPLYICSENKFIEIFQTFSLSTMVVEFFFIHFVGLI